MDERIMLERPVFAKRLFRLRLRIRRAQERGNSTTLLMHTRRIRSSAQTVLRLEMESPRLLSSLQPSPAIHSIDGRIEDDVIPIWTDISSHLAAGVLDTSPLRVRIA